MFRPTSFGMMMNSSHPRPGIFISARSRNRQGVGSDHFAFGPEILVWKGIASHHHPHLITPCKPFMNEPSPDISRCAHDENFDISRQRPCRKIGTKEVLMDRKQGWFHINGSHAWLCPCRYLSVNQIQAAWYLCFPEAFLHLLGQCKIDSSDENP